MRAPPSRALAPTLCPRGNCGGAPGDGPVSRRNDRFVHPRGRISRRLVGGSVVTCIPRLAASTYLNSAPIVHAFVEGSQVGRVSIAPDPAPSVCARLLA